MNKYKRNKIILVILIGVYSIYLFADMFLEITEVSFQWLFITLLASIFLNDAFKNKSEDDITQYKLIRFCSIILYLIAFAMLIMEIIILMK